MHVKLLPATIKENSRSTTWSGRRLLPYCLVTIAALRRAVSEKRSAILRFLSRNKRLFGTWQCAKYSNAPNIIALALINLLLSQKRADTQSFPVANAGPAQIVASRASVALDGSTSSDPGGHPLHYLRAACVAITSGKRFFPTCYGTAFTDRLFGLRKCATIGQHQFDQLSVDLGIEHRLTPPMRPRTKCMVERFNGRMEDVLQIHRFKCCEDLEQAIQRHITLYNEQLPQPALASQTPLRAMADWHKRSPEAFKNSHTTLRDVTHSISRDVTSRGF